MPGTREMMNSALAISGGMPMSPQTAAIAPSMLTGSACPSGSAADHQFDGADHLDVRRLRPRARAPSGTAARRADRACGSDGRSPGSARRSRRTAARCSLAASRYEAPLAHQLEPGVEKLHAALDVAAVVPAEAEHAGRHARAQRRAGRGGVARRERRRRRRPVIDERHEDRFHQAADRRRRQFAHQQQVDRLAEGEPPHDLVERVAAHEDLVRLDAGQRRLPLIRAVVLRRQHRFWPARARRSGCGAWS